MKVFENPIEGCPYCGHDDPDWIGSDSDSENVEEYCPECDNRWYLHRYKTVDGKLQVRDSFFQQDLEAIGTMSDRQFAEYLCLIFNTQYYERGDFSILEVLSPIRKGSLVALANATSLRMATIEDIVIFGISKRVLSPGDLAVVGEDIIGPARTTYDYEPEAE